MYVNVSSVVEFQRWWVLKSKTLAKNQNTQRKPLYFVNTGNASLSKIGHHFRKQIGSKKFFFTKKWSPKYLDIHQ